MELLLAHLGARGLVVAGLSSDLCVMFSAMDALVRGCRLWMPEDGTAAQSLERKRAALAWMALALRCRIDSSGSGSASAG